MIFEFDKTKSEANRKKHGIDFKRAQNLWKDENRLVIPAKSDDEIRYALIACVGRKNWTAFYTIRGTYIRLISVRRSRKEEKELYESERPR